MDKMIIKNKIYNFFIEREGDDILDSIDNIDFIDEGILDSLDFFSLAVFIEKEFGIKLKMTDEDTFKKMRKIETLIDLILQLSLNS
ncbi:MAG: acyl carrier protein [Prochlorococcus marinus CUG1431]|nr:acyl carrier protein [Prochlorococcus marinus CUG1431]